MCTSDVKLPEDGIGSFVCLKKKAMTAAAFSADGSILAVAAETVITLWDPEHNVLVVVLGEIQKPIRSLSFAGKSDYLVSVSEGSQPQLSVYVACAVDASMFAVLVVGKSCNNETTVLKGRDGVILLFNVTDPLPVATWPRGEDLVLFKAGQELVATIEETGKLGYASVYGELPEFELKSKDDELWEATAPSRPSERPWESIFSGSSHDLPPLTKLCSPFLESLLERRTTTSTTAIVE
ncbi:hypothetical protein G4B88_020646 [Cannabis sativa]|uniref:WD repeat-containing protein 75 second beta-propeller domain-containing protein n=1 Tax=Cannabis sativa TaxID=3483 RepID=A0A7J6HMV4_CANSA|nr:hypothetical protein G4B88_020646 [Cannabis sativa]